MHALPGDLALQVAAARYVETAPDADLAAATRAELGLDRPLLWQYADWLRNLLSLDFGRSLITGRDVLSDLAPYVANTIILGGLGLVGGAVIVGSATYISHREMAVARRVQTPPAPATKL